MAGNELEQGTGASRKAAVRILAAMFVAPVLYVALYHGNMVRVSAAVSANVAAMNTVQSEQATSSDPSVANALTLSMTYINAGTPAKALPLLKALLAGDPKNAVAWNNLCVAHMGLQEFNRAVAACEAGIRADAGMQLLQNNLKWAQDESAKAKSVAAAESAKPREQRNVDSYILEGLSRMHVGEYRKAQTAWYQCLAIDPKNAIAQNDIGVAFMLLDQPTEAAQSFGKAVNMDGTSGLYKNNLAWAQRTK